MVMLNSKPDMLKFRKNTDNNATLLKASLSPVFGGNVLQPVGSLGRKRDKANPLREEISKFEIDGMNGGGYYVLQNIRESEQTQIQYDIYLLTDQVENQSDLRILKEVHEESSLSMRDLKKIKAPVKHSLSPERKSSLGKRQLDKNPVFFSEIKESVSGLARIVKYINHSVTPFLN